MKMHENAPCFRLVLAIQAPVGGGGSQIVSGGANPKKMLKSPPGLNL